MNGNELDEIPDKECKRKNVRNVQQNQRNSKQTPKWLQREFLTNWMNKGNL